MALAWVLHDEPGTSVLMGASNTAQMDNAVAMLERRQFSDTE